MQQKCAQVPNAPVVPILLDPAITRRIAMGSKLPHVRVLMDREDLWHKVKVVKGGQYDKDTVLKTILREVEPNDLLPVKYQVCGEDAYFSVKNCSPALEILCQRDMIVRSPNGDGIVLVITLGFTSINELKVIPSLLLLTALTKKYNPDQKTLDLENFHADPDLDKSVYCPLWQLKTFNDVLNLAKTSIATIEHLNLKHNELFDISAIENSKLTSIKYLDLRHNNLLNMSALTPLKELEIIKLWLDGNPLCENYSTAKQYVKSAKTYCPYLQELDGVCITEKMPLLYRDYFSNDNTQRFARKFVSHFFALYDQLDRTVLRGLYHKDAVYSMSFTIPHNIAQKTGLSLYLSSRNLLRKSSKKNTGIYYGQEDILAAFCKLPRSYHDRNSFTYDILYDSDKCIAFTVSGFFKKLSFGTNVLSYSRTFVLLASVDDEYHILNDQYHISAAPKNMTPDKIVVKYIYDEIEPVCFTPSEKKVLITRVQQITTMNKEWSETYLSEAEWDMRKAISTFMKDFKSSSIPENAFVSQGSQ